MPYNSSAFEKQLAKYKAAQAVKAVADMPDDRHRAQSRVSSGRGELKPSRTAKVTLEGVEGGPALRADQTSQGNFDQPIIIVKGRAFKPWYRRGWFNFILFSVLSTAAMPIFFKDEMHQVFDMAENVKTTTGVDPFAVKTYVDMVRGHAAEPAQQPPMVINNTPVNPNDMHAVVDQAQQNAAAVVKQGPEQSMQYIQQETERLNNMAKDLDKQAGH